MIGTIQLKPSQSAFPVPQEAARPNGCFSEEPVQTPETEQTPKVQRRRRLSESLVQSSLGTKPGRRTRRRLHRFILSSSTEAEEDRKLLLG